MGDKIHPTHFQVPEMPWREKEKQAILLFRDLLVWLKAQDAWGEVEFGWFLDENESMIDWVMKYKGE